MVLLNGGDQWGLGCVIPGVIVGYLNQDSIYFYDRFHQENLKQDYLNIFPSKVSRYFYTLIIYYCKFEITTVPQIYL